MLEVTKCDGIMLARGSLRNPWIFQDLARLPLPLVNSNSKDMPEVSVEDTQMATQPKPSRPPASPSKSAQKHVFGQDRDVHNIFTAAATISTNKGTEAPESGRSTKHRPDASPKSKLKLTECADADAQEYWPSTEDLREAESLYMQWSKKVHTKEKFTKFHAVNFKRLRQITVTGNKRIPVKSPNTIHLT
jgi:tRNA-dihydrouridine synthase